MASSHDPPETTAVEDSAVAEDSGAATDFSEEVLDCVELDTDLGACELDVLDFVVAAVLDVVLSVSPGYAWAATAESAPVRVRLPAISQWLMRLSLRRAASRALTWGLDVIGAVWLGLIRRV
jgi:hypothetical protein